MDRCAKNGSAPRQHAAFNDEPKTTERCVHHIHNVTIECIDVLKLAQEFAYKTANVSIPMYFYSPRIVRNL